MLVRLRSVRRLSREQFRLALDLVDLERGDWGLGDCIGQVTVLDGPRGHTVQPWGRRSTSTNCAGTSRRRARRLASCGRWGGPSAATSTASSRRASSVLSRPARPRTPGKRPTDQVRAVRSTRARGLQRPAPTRRYK
jgi:hypothetical protein